MQGFWVFLSYCLMAVMAYLSFFIMKHPEQAERFILPWNRWLMRKIFWTPDAYRDQLKLTGKIGFITAIVMMVAFTISLAFRH